MYNIRELLEKALEESELSSASTTLSYLVTGIDSLRTNICSVIKLQIDNLEIITSTIGKQIINLRSDIPNHPQ